MVGAEGFEGADKRRLGAVAHGIVIEFLGGDARRLGEIGVAALILALFVEAVEQHRDGAAQMRHDEFDVRVAVRDLLGDHVQHKGRVLQRGADRSPEIVIDDERRADPGSGRMDEQDRAAPVHLGIDRLELGLGDRAVEADDVHVDADAAELVEAALHLFQRGVDMRQWEHHV